MREDFIYYVEQIKSVVPESVLNLLLRPFILFVFIFLFYFVCKNLIVRTLDNVLSRKYQKWSTELKELYLLEKGALLFSFILAEIWWPLMHQEGHLIFIAAHMILQLCLVIQSIRVLFSFGDLLLHISEQKAVVQQIPVKSMVQLSKVFLSLLATILVISIISQRSPAYLLSGLGVATGLIVLTFRDTILGFIAGIQLTANKMVRQGDWIEMLTYGADGTVQEVTLTTVKVKNWDKTVSMIPAYALVSNSFKNWRGMEESGGRRIKRSLLLDMDTIRFVQQADIDSWSQISILKPYIDLKLANLRVKESDAELERLTNVGTFRTYIEAYLQAHPLIRKDMTCIVRQLAPTAYGLPIEVYAFSSDTQWKSFEKIQSDIFDHLLAWMPKFDLKIYQRPSV